jgi:hypothetical protein
MAERNQSIRLLKDVVPVFESELPVSKSNAESNVESRWVRAKVANAQKQLLRDFYDDFCIEVGLIAVELETQSTHLSIPDVLWDAINPLLELLESLLTDQLCPRKSVCLTFHIRTAAKAVNKLRS